MVISAEHYLHSIPTRTGWPGIDCTQCIVKHYRSPLMWKDRLPFFLYSADERVIFCNFAHKLTVYVQFSSISLRFSLCTVSLVIRAFSLINFMLEFLECAMNCSIVHNKKKIQKIQHQQLSDRKLNLDSISVVWAMFLSR